MTGLTFIVGLGAIVTVAAVDKFCETYGFKNAAGFLKIAIPTAAFISGILVLGALV